MISFRWFSGFWIIIFITVGLSLQSAATDRELYNEYDVKAAFIYNMIKFTNWPDEIDIRKSAVNICSMGDGLCVEALGYIEGRNVKNKKIFVRQITSPQQIKDCNVLYIAGTEQMKLGNIIKTAQESQTLTIGDTEGFAQKGVIINLYKRNNRIRFQVNILAMENAGLRISADLLKLGDIIRPNNIDY